MNRNYECMIIARPDLSDQEREEIFDKISKKIESVGGEVISSKLWAKERTFYFFLKGHGAEKKKYNKGCYWLIDFMIDIDKLAEIKEIIRLEERILRNIIVNKEAKLKVPKARTAA